MNKLHDIYTISLNAEIVLTNFWDDYDNSNHESHISFKMGVMRILCPLELGLQDIAAMKRATSVFIIRLPYQDPHFFAVDFTDQNQSSELIIYSRNPDIDEYLPISAEGSYFGIAAYLPDSEGNPMCQFRSSGLYILSY